MNDAILEAEEQLISAMKSSDIQRLDHLLYDKLIFTMQDGQVLTKAADMEMHSSGKLAINCINPSEQLVKSVGSVSVVSVRMQIEGSYEGTSFSGDLRYMRVWKMIDGRLQIIAASCAVIT